MITNFKRKAYRNKKILDACRDEPCLVNLPGCTGGGADSVPAHSNCSDDGKGGKIKADDIFVAIACQRCHDILDRRMKTKPFPRAPRTLLAEEIQWYHDRAIKRTIRRMIDKGVLK